jgi:hypothetical protein
MSTELVPFKWNPGMGYDKDDIDHNLPYKINAKSLLMQPEIFTQNIMSLSNTAEQLNERCLKESGVCITDPRLGLIDLRVMEYNEIQSHIHGLVNHYDVSHLLLMFVCLKAEERTEENFLSLMQEINTHGIKCKSNQFNFCLLVFYVVNSITDLDPEDDGKKFLDLCKKIQVDSFDERGIGKLIPEQQDYFGNMLRVIIKFRCVLSKDHCRESLQLFLDNHNDTLLDGNTCHDNTLRRNFEKFGEAIPSASEDVRQAFEKEFQKALDKCIISLFGETMLLRKDVEFLYKLVPNCLRTVDITNCFLESIAGQGLAERMNPYERLCYSISLSTVSKEQKFECFKNFLEEYSGFICQQDLLVWHRTYDCGYRNIFCAIASSSSESEMATLLINFISKHFGELGIGKATVMFNLVPPEMQADAFCYLYFTHLQQQTSGELNFNDMIVKAKQFGLGDGELLKLYYTFSNQFQN